jgi:hypothetical protein
VTIAGEELAAWMREWRECLLRFYDAHRDAIE